MITMGSSREVFVFFFFLGLSLGSEKSLVIISKVIDAKWIFALGKDELLLEF